MKKTLIALLLVALLTVIIAPAALAAGSAEVSVSSATVLPGDEVTLVVSIANNPGVGSGKFVVEYDSSVLTLVALEAGEVMGTASFTNLPANLINFARTTNYTKDGVLFTATFKVAANAANGEYPVKVVVKNLNSANKGNPAVVTTVVAGKVTVHAHVWSWVTDTEATCGKDGAKHEECTCGAKQNEGTKIPATGNHTWTWVTDTEATCGKDGTKHEECTCGAKRNEGTKIPATGNHTWTWVTDTEATCGKDGAKHEECTCGAKRNEGTKIPATGEHDWEWVTDKEATSTEEGEKHEECKDCGAKQNEGTKIPMIDDVPVMGDNTTIYVIFALVALVSLAGVYYVTKKNNI